MDKFLAIKFTNLAVQTTKLFIHLYTLRWAGTNVLRDH